MGKEAKIGLAVIGVLLVVFCGVLANRLIGAGDDATASQDGEQAGATSIDKNKPAGETPKASLPDKPTIVSAKAASGEAPGQVTASAPSRWTTVSDSGAAQSGTASTSGASSPPSFMPKLAASGVSRYADSSQSSSADTWQQSQSTAAAPLPPQPASVPYQDDAAETASQLPAGSGQASAEQSSPYARSTTVQRQISPYASNTGQSYRSTTSYSPSVRGQTVSSPGNAYSALDRSSQYADSVDRSGAGQSSVGQNGYVRTNVGRNEDGTYTVQPNDSYWTISEQLYGSGRYFKALAQFNRGKHPQADQLRVGDNILAPTEAELREALADLCPSTSHGESDRQRVSAAGMSGSYAGGRVYVVEDGDTLSDIARYELGKSARWVEIYQMNRAALGTDFDYLTPGTRLMLPDDGRATDSVTQRPGSTLQR